MELFRRSTTHSSTFRGTRKRPRVAVAALTLATSAALVFSGCAGPNQGGSGGDLPLAKGPRTAVLPNANPDIIIDNPIQKLPVTVEGADGEKVTVKDTSRIIGIDRPGTITRILYALGLQDNIVGRDKTADFPAAQSIPLVTTKAHTLNAEKIIAAQPSVVIVDYSVGPGAVIHQLRDIGIPVVYIDAERSLSRIPKLVNQVGHALGVDQKQIDKVIKTTQDQIDKAIKRAQAMSDHRRIAVLVIRGTNVAFIGGPGSGADELVEALGGVDVGKDVGLTQDFTPMTPEAMVKAAPDSVIVMEDGMKSAGGVEGVVSAPGMAQTPAGRNRSVVSILDSALFSFGPGSGEIIDALADALYGESQKQ